MSSPIETATVEPDRKAAQWLRILPLVFFGLIAFFVLLGSYLMSVVQFIVVIVQDEPNDQLRDFGARIGAYLGALVNYLSYETDQMPFPFATFPDVAAPPAPAKPKAKPRKTTKTAKTASKD